MIIQKLRTLTTRLKGFSSLAPTETLVDREKIERGKGKLNARGYGKIKKAKNATNAKKANKAKKAKMAKKEKKA